jgi:hypothetical protein
LPSRTKHGEIKAFNNYFIMQFHLFGEEMTQFIRLCTITLMSLMISIPALAQDAGAPAAGGYSTSEGSTADAGPVPEADEAAPKSRKHKKNKGKNKKKAAAKKHAKITKKKGKKKRTAHS